jgi:hypothetical protein
LRIYNLKKKKKIVGDPDLMKHVKNLTYLKATTTINEREREREREREPFFFFFLSSFFFFFFFVFYLMAKLNSELYVNVFILKKKKINKKAHFRFSKI